MAFSTIERAKRPITEVGLRHSSAEDLPHSMHTTVGQQAFILLHAQFHDFHQLCLGIFGKFNNKIDAAAKPCVAIQQFLHRLLVTCKDYHRVLAVVFTLLDDLRDCLIAEKSLSILQKCIGLIDQQDTVLRPLKRLLHELCGTAHMVRYQGCTTSLHQMSPL